MFRQAKQIGGGVIMTIFIAVLLSTLFDIQARLGMYGPFDPVLELLYTVSLAIFAILGYASLLTAYDYLTEF